MVGLAYTELGGSILYLEAKKSTFTRNPGVGALKCTGSLGEVMKESMQIAYTYARRYLNGLGNDFLEKYSTIRTGTTSIFTLRKARLPRTGHRQASP